MFKRFPRTIFREQQVVFSKEELAERVNEGAKMKKVCIMSLYSFEEILGTKAKAETAVIDCILWEGEEDFCRAMIRKFNQYPSILIYDGEIYQAIVFKDSTLQELESLHANTKLDKLILIPGCFNLKTGKKCTIIERNKI